MSIFIIFIACRFLLSFAFTFLENITHKQKANSNFCIKIHSKCFLLAPSVMKEKAIGIAHPKDSHNLQIFVLFLYRFIGSSFGSELDSNLFSDNRFNYLHFTQVYNRCCFHYFYMYMKNHSRSILYQIKITQINCWVFNFVKPLVSKCYNNKIIQMLSSITLRGV